MNRPMDIRQTTFLNDQSKFLSSKIKAYIMMSLSLTRLIKRGSSVLVSYLMNIGFAWGFFSQGDCGVIRAIDSMFERDRWVGPRWWWVWSFPNQILLWMLFGTGVMKRFYTSVRGHNTCMRHKKQSLFIFNSIWKFDKEFCLFKYCYLTLPLIDHLKPFKISTFKNAHWFCTHMVIPFEQCW